MMMQTIGKSVRASFLAMARLYRKKRISPYRNYVRTNKKITEDVVYLTGTYYQNFLTAKDRIKQLMED